MRLHVTGARWVRINVCVVACRDKHGRTYYRNTIAKCTQWERPVDFVDEDDITGTPPPTYVPKRTVSGGGGGDARGTGSAAGTVTVTVVPKFASNNSNKAGGSPAARAMPNATPLIPASPAAVATTPYTGCAPPAPQVQQQPHHQQCQPQHVAPARQTPSSSPWTWKKRTDKYVSFRVRASPVEDGEGCAALFADVYEREIK